MEAFEEALFQFIWQHNHRGKWITYGEHDIKSLNKAVFNYQRTVRLIKKDKNIITTAYLDKLLQENTSTNIVQKIRPLVVYKKHLISWLFQESDGTYSSYKPHIVFALEIAFQKKEKCICFYDEGNEFRIDINEFKEKVEGVSMVKNVQREEFLFQEREFSKEVRKIINYDAVSRLLCQKSLQLSTRFVNLPSSSSTLSQMTLTPSQVEMPEILTDEDSFLGPDPEPLIEDAENYFAIKENYSIYFENGAHFSAALVFASIEKNTNKFLIMQLLQHNDHKTFTICTQSGRIGHVGRFQERNFQENVVQAKSKFETKFYELTQNFWKDKHDFQYKIGKYSLVRVDLRHQNEIVHSRVNVLTEVLPESVFDLFTLIMNQKMMKEIMKDLSFDSFIPLGKLTSNQIRQGYSALSKVARILSKLTEYSSASSEKVSVKDLITACDEFYATIPHNCGSKKLLLLQTVEDVKEKLRLLEILSNVRMAMKMLEYEPTFDHPLVKYSYSLTVAVKPLDLCSPSFKSLEKILKITHGPTHKFFDMEIVSAFECTQRDESFFMDMSVKKLLWHGSRITNWIGILKKGLRVAPSEAPSSGYMFGKGIYFSDVSSKSANYCYATKKNDQGIIAVCEVSLGRIKYVNHAHYGCSKEYLEEQGYDSLCCFGCYSASYNTCPDLSNEALTPCGPLTFNRYDGSKSLNYAEYVVYDTHQVKIRYLIRVKFNFI